MIRTCVALLIIMGSGACTAAGDGASGGLPLSGLTPDLRYDSPERFPLSGIRQIAVDRTGAIAVLDARTPSILLFAPDGRFEGAVPGGGRFS